MSDGPTNDPGSERNADVASALAQLTSGWKPAPNVAPEALTAARAALAGSLVAGKPLRDLHGINLPLRAGPALNPQLESDLLSVVSQVTSESAPRTIAVVRSALAASLENPTGRPEWTRGARITQSYGPFQDLQGAPHWVDLFPLTRSIQFAFDNSGNTFGVFPVHTLVLLVNPSHLSLGAGSVWFLANLLSSALPGFTGFTITGGSLSSSAPLSLQNGVYVLPAGATLTAKVTLAPAPPPSGSGGTGQDAAAAVFTPPSDVNIHFRDGGTAFDVIADSSATAYGSTIALHWNKSAPFQLGGLPLMVVPCDAAPASFGFATVASTVFTPTGSAPITAAGWALPLSATTISTLPEAAGPGAAAIEFGAGVSLTTTIEPTAVPLTSGFLEIATGSLLLTVSGKAKPVTTTYQLWPLPAPSQLNATLQFATLKQFIITFSSTPAEELLISTGQATAHLDRPVDATGNRFGFQAPGLLYLLHSTAADLLFVIAVRPDAPSPIVPLALTNALLGVDAPAVLILGGILSGLSLENAGAGLYFNLRWLLPTLPDPYAATFDLTTIPEQAPPSVGTLLAQITWAGGTSDPSLGYVLLPPPQGSSVVGTPFPSSIALRGGANDLVAVSRGAMPALLDLSTKVDLFGVALAPEIGRLAQSGGNRDQAPADPSNTAPALALTGMSLALNSALIATFALPQSSWEPMESTDPDEPGPIFCEPASDGFPLLISSPDSQRLVPFSPAPVLTSNIENVAAGHPFAALFSLPFGLNALIIEPNRHVATKFGRIPSSFIFFGGQFRENRPLFLESFVPNPPAGTPKLGGAVQLTLKPTFPDRPAAMFQGFTEPDTSHGPNIGPAPNGYGYTILGAISGVGTMFDGQFGSGGKLPGVPLRRIDFSGYGSSIFSEWNKPDEIPGIIKVQFETSIGRTGYEVIQAASVIYPYCILVVRTVTMQRQNAGWVKRTDSGWQAVSPGQFQFPADAANTQLLWANAVHPGALAGAFNVRNIRDNFGGEPIVVNTPSGFQFRKVLFDSDLGVNPNLNVVSGGFTAPIPGVPNPPVLTASRDMEGWVQILPIAQTPDPATMQQLFAQIGALTPAIACSIEAGRFNNVPGTTLRSSAFEVNIITEGNAGATVPALGVALRGAPQIPRGGGWSLGQRRYSDPAPSALPNDFPLPLVQPAGVNDFWYLADVTDVLQLTQPDNFYSLMHSTGTNKVLFESPQIPTAGASPGIQFPKPSPPGPPKPGAAPTNPGSPNLGDIASILNSTGLFPDIANVISLLQGTIEQINTIGQGFQYSKTFNFDPNEKVTIADLAGILNVVLQYADISLNNANPAFPVTPATLKYTVDSSASPSWTLSIGPLSFVVTIPKFSADPLLIITGGFYADEHTKAGLTNLNVQMGNALSLIKDVFSDLQSIAQYLPGGAGAQLDIALSNGKLTVTDTFSIADLPLGLGDLTDVSLNLSVGVQLQPLSVDFAIGVGSPDHPFNWIVSPLAGNGLMEFGLRANQPSFVIQAGIGLGLAIDLGIASGSASVTIAFRIDASGSEIILMAILSGQASVDVLDGLASATITLTAALGFGLSLSPPPVKFTPPPPSLPSSITLGPETITLLASCSVGIHLSICWVVSVDWDGSWQFSQSVTTPQITVNV